MRDIKSEEAENLQWQDHRSHIPQPSENVSSYGAHPPSASPRVPHANPHHDRDSDVRPNIATLSSQRSPSSTLPLLTSPSSASLKRPFGFQQPNDSPDGDGTSMADPENAQKPTIHQDHQLLSFFRLPDRHSLFDLRGREQTFELSLNLQGMFFLAETSIPTVGGKPPYQQPELTCYRRNLFSVAGSVSVPRGTSSVITDQGERATILSQELSISATESVDGNAVRLIVIPWKTPPPNMPQLPAKQDQEPPSFPLVPFEGNDGNENMICPIAWRRLQFRIATANNGRRKELQQHFVLRAKVVASLSNGSRISVCEASTAPIVVRGRSPRNFQNKKETPLSSKSTASALIESHPDSLSRDSSNAKNIKNTNMQTAVLPQSSFQFDTSHLAPFSNWPSISQQLEQTPSVPKTSNPRSRGSLNTLHSSQSSPQIRRHNSSIGEGSTHFLTSPPIAPLAIGNYPDTNPRPTKSPRHLHSPENVSQMYHSYREEPEVSFHENLTDEPESYSRDYFVGSSHPEPWVSTGQTSVSAATQHQFQYPPNMFIKNEQNHPAPFPWSNV